MEKGQPVGVFIGLQRGFVHQTANGKVRHQEPEKFLPYQFRRFAAQYNLSTAQMCFQFVESGFDFPAFVVQGCQFLSRGL